MGPTTAVKVDSDKPWKNPSSFMFQILSDFSLVMEEAAFPHSLDASGLRVSPLKVSSWIYGRMHIEQNIQETANIVNQDNYIVTLLVIIISTMSAWSWMRRPSHTAWMPQG